MKIIEYLLLSFEIKKPQITHLLKFSQYLLFYESD